MAGAKALATVLCSPEDATSSVKQLASSLASPPFFKNSKKRSRDERSSDGYSEYRRRNAAHREKEKPRTSSSKQQKLKTLLRHMVSYKFFPSHVKNLREIIIQTIDGQKMTNINSRSTEEVLAAAQGMTQLAVAVKVPHTAPPA